MVVDERSAGGLSPQEALAQISYLRELVDNTRMRVSAWARPLIVWGVAWVAGYAVTGWSLAPIDGAKPTGAQVALTWAVALSVAGLGMASRRRPGAQSTTLGRQLAWLTMILFVAVFAGTIFLSGASTKVVSAYWPFWVGVIYAVNGIFIGRELVFVGAWLIAASIASIFMPTWVQQFFLALTGGGGLIASGLIARRLPR